MREEIVIRENGTKRVMYHFDGPSLTRQEFKDECDLEKMIKRFSATPEGREALQRAQNFVGGRYEDVSSVPDYREAIELVKRADEAFEGLPSDIRKRFDHDPAKFIDFVDDPKNREELVSLGLVAKPADSVVKEPETPAG